MKRTIALLLLVTTACTVENRSSIEIDGRAAPDETSCKFAPGGVNLPGPGLLDIAATAMPSYSLVVYIKNNLTNPTTASPPVVGQPAANTASSMAWTANAAWVRVNPSGYVDPYDPNPTLLDYHGENVTPLDGQTIQPAGGTATQLVEAVSGPLGAMIAPLVAPGPPQRIVLGITLEGRTGDGAPVNTGEWYFPLNVCNGCLVAPTCQPGEILVSSNCFGPWQDSPPVCAAPK